MKKIRRTIKILLPLLIFSLINGCYHDSDHFFYDDHDNIIDDNSGNDLHKIVGDYMIFQEGSFWVYERDSAIVDTVTVDSLIIDSVPYLIGRRTFYEERARVYYHSTYYGFDYYDLMLGKSEFIERTRMLSDSFSIFDYVFMNPPKENSNLTFKKYDYFELDGYEYYDVFKVTASENAHVYNADSLVDEYVTMQYFFAKNIGLIKRVNVDENEKWNIVEYDVYQ